MYISIKSIFPDVKRFHFTRFPQGFKFQVKLQWQA